MSENKIDRLRKAYESFVGDLKEEEDFLPTEKDPDLEFLERVFPLVTKEEEAADEKT